MIENRYPGLDRIPKLFTVEELADLLKMNAWTIRNHLAYGDLECFRLGRLIRISEQQICNWLKENLDPNPKAWIVDEEQRRRINKLDTEHCF